MKRLFTSLLILICSLVILQNCVNEVDPSLPKLTTSNIIEITNSNATSGGEVLSSGGATVVRRGVCWNTSTNPTIDNDVTIDGVGKGTFTSSLTNLVGATTYYVRAYATNSVGTAYGDELEFTTNATPTLPQISTTPISNITNNSALSGGNITSGGNSSVTQRGVCWSAATGPTINDNKTSDGTGTGIFISALTSLSASTTYYVRAYATNGIGTSYGDEINFTTPSITATVYAVKDASIYNTNPPNLNTNVGGGGDQILQVGYASPTSTYARSLVQFDLSTIPSNAVIESVSLEFKLSTSGAYVPVVYVHKVEQAWTEGTTAGTCTAGSACNTQGAVISSSNDVTWNETSYSGVNTNLWIDIGGTFTSTASASSLDVGASTVLYISSGMKDDVQGWISNSSTNFGWILKTDFITDTMAMRRFYSRESAQLPGNSTFAPKLTITYH